MRLSEVVPVRKELFQDDLDALLPFWAVNVGSIDHDVSENFRLERKRRKDDHTCSICLAHEAQH